MDNKEIIRQRAQGNRKDEIKVIHATPVESIYDSNKVLRVAAYCRVSTDSDEQVTSYELQKNYYQEYIAKHENWKLVNIYVDEGISGTSRAHREAFNKMIDDAKAGLIDLIIAKSVSRFARNVVDCLTTVRELQSLNPPVRLLFETENIDTAKSDSEILLNLLSIFAQEESHTKSEIMTWSIHQRFASGNFITPRLFGYEVDINKPDRYIIIEEEAKVIRLVYAMYVTGYKYSEIAEQMAKLNYVSNTKGEKKWNANIVENIINNERRCGKIIAWKTYTPSYLDHKVKKNNGNRDQFILDDHHEGIVPQVVYEYSLKIQRMRKISHFKGIVPSLSVIKSGSLKGFVPVITTYPGFTYENYLFASNYAYSFDKNGERVEEGIKIRKGDVSSFDLSGYEKVDSHLFLNKSYPILSFSKNTLLFNKTCLGKMKEPDYIELLFEPKELLLVIRETDKDNPNAIRWKNDNGKSLLKSCSGFILVLYECLKWNSDYKYRIVGTKKETSDESIIIFDLNSAVPYKSKVIEKEDSIDKVGISYFDEYFAYHYGRNIYEDSYLMRLYLLDLFKSWNVKASEVDSEEEWKIWAKEIVGNHIKELQEQGGN